MPPALQTWAESVSRERPSGAQSALIAISGVGSVQGSLICTHSPVPDESLEGGSSCLWGGCGSSLPEHFP